MVNPMTVMGAQDTHPVLYRDKRLGRHCVSAIERKTRAALPFII
jgi:hypothetical protein